MNMDEDVNADNKEQLQVEETDDSCILDYFEIVPVDRGTDGSSTTECVSGDWLAEVNQENLTVVKQEPDDVCCVILAYFCIFSLLQPKPDIPLTQERLKPPGIQASILGACSKPG